MVKWSVGPLVDHSIIGIMDANTTPSTNLVKEIWFHPMEPTQCFIPLPDDRSTTGFQNVWFLTKNGEMENVQNM